MPWSMRAANVIGMVQKSRHSQITMYGGKINDIVGIVLANSVLVLDFFVRSVLMDKEYRWGSPQEENPATAVALTSTLTAEDLDTGPLRSIPDRIADGGADGGNHQVARLGSLGRANLYRRRQWVKRPPGDEAATGPHTYP